MGRPKTFLNWIFSKNKKPYYIDTNGIVLEGDVNTHLKPDGQPAHLQAAPIGWKGTEVKYGRNTTYWGIFRDFTNTLSFGLDGAKIIRNLIWTGGFEAVAYFALHKKDLYLWPLTYKPWYIGEIDLSKFKQNKDSVEVTVLDGGVAKWLKAFENTTFELPIAADPQRKTLFLDGFPFVNKLEYTIYDGQQFNGANESQIGAGLVVQEGTTQGVIAQDELYDQFGIVIPGNENWLFESVTKSVIFNPSGQLSVDMGASRSFPLFIRKLKIVNGVSVASTYYPFSTGILAAGLQTVDFSLSIPVNPGERLYLVGQGIIGSPGIVFTIKTGIIKASYEVTFAATFCYGLTPKRVFELLTEKITQGKFYCSSKFLDSITDILYTSGPSLRNFTDNTTVIKISFTDFFKSLKGLDFVNKNGVGLSVEADKLVIEDLLHYFQSPVIMDLGEVNNMVIETAQDLIYNTIKVGYANQTYDKVNGLDEVNVTQQYTTDVLKVVKELDLIDPVRTDATGIEITRLDLYKKDSTDSKSDNDTFKINVTKGGTIIYHYGLFTVTVNNAIRFASPQLQLLNVGDSFQLTGTAIDGTYTVALTTYTVDGIIIIVDQVLVNGNYSGTISYVSATTYIPKRLTYSSISGIMQPAKKYNIELSSKTMLLNQSSFVHSFLENDGGKIHFQSGEKNSEMSRTYLSGETITEKADITVGNLTPKLFLPYYVSIDVEVPLTFRQLMDTNPYGQISWTYKGLKMYGYLFDGSIRPATNEHLKFKVLLSPNNDLTKLI